MVSFSSRTDWGFLALLALIACAPFERVEPLLVLPGQNLTNLEILAVVALLTWLLTHLRKESLLSVRIPLAVPLLLLLGLFLVSAVLVAQHQAVAFRFTGRLALGILIYALVVIQASSPSRLRVVVCALAVSGTLVGVLGILEYWEVNGVASLLGLFRPTGFSVAGHPRVSSTLQYSTITSMYLEITLGWGLALLLWVRSSNPWRWTLTTLPALVIMGTCIFLTMTRAGLGTLVVMLSLATGVVVWRRGLGFETTRLLLLDVILAVVFLAVLGTSDYGLRLRSPDESLWYRAEYRVPCELRLEAGSLNEIEVALQNRGMVTWTREPANPIRLSYHWLPRDSDEMVIFEGVRTDLQRKVAPGETTRLPARVLAPPEPGEYRLVWDMLKEHRFWFSMLGVEMGTTQVTVEEAEGEMEVFALEDQLPLPKPRFSISRRELWRVAAGMIRDHPFLGVDPDNFRMTYGSVIGVADADRSYHSHNLYLEVFVSIGIAGGLVFLWLLVRLLSPLARLWRRTENLDLAFWVGASAAAAAILVHGLIGYFLEFTPVIVMAWTTFGLIVAGERVNRETDAEGHSAGRL